MQLTETEQRLVARLRQQEQSFIRWRWMVLLTAIACVLTAFYCFHVVQRMAVLSDPPAVLAVAFTIPIVYMMFGVAAFLGVHLVTRWNGKPETLLLLRLIDESQTK